MGALDGSIHRSVGPITPRDSYSSAASIPQATVLQFRVLAVCPAFAECPDLRHGRVGFAPTLRHPIPYPIYCTDRAVLAGPGRIESHVLARVGRLSESSHGRGRGFESPIAHHIAAGHGLLRVVTCRCFGSRTRVRDGMGWSEVVSGACGVVSDAVSDVVLSIGVELGVEERLHGDEAAHR